MTDLEIIRNSTSCLQWTFLTHYISYML